jgi:hypothetical protein
MGEAVKALLGGVDRYIVTIRKASNNPGAGKSTSSDLVLYESDSLDFSAGIDSRLLRSRRVIVILVAKDSGIAKIDLTNRTWEVWQGSARLRDRLIVLNRAMIEGAKSRWTTATSASLVFFAPLFIYSAIFALWSGLDAKVRNDVYGRHPNQAAADKLTPHWLHEVAQVTRDFWPVFILASLVIALIRISGGGLRVWPESFTAQSLSNAIYRIRGITFTLENASTIIVGVVIAVIASALTFWFAH